MTAIIKRCRGEKTRGVRAIDGFRKKFMMPDSEMRKIIERQKIKKLTKN